MSAPTPVVQHYRQALERCRRQRKESAPVERMAELIALLDLAATFDAGLAGAELLSAALRIVLEEVQTERGALFARLDEGSFAIRASTGLPDGSASTLDVMALGKDLTALEPVDGAEARHGLVLLCPIRRRERTIGVLGLGPRAGGRVYGAEEHAFLRAATVCAAAPFENLLLHDELRRVKQELSLKVFQLHNLFDVSRELTGGAEEDWIQSHITTTVMGHFLVSRCALYLLGPQGLTLVHERGLGRQVERSPIPLEEARVALQDLPKPRAVAELPDGPLRLRFDQGRLALAVPLIASDRVEGVLAVGERASRTPFSGEDLEFAETLARHAAAALESARLHRLRVEKQRQDHELRIAQEIQRSLFPARLPEIPGFEVAADSRPCYEVGGDSYDWIDLGNGRLALVVADASGKGTPASLLMASVHAFVHARAGTDAPALMMERLNRFLLARTRANQYVTLFYAELDSSQRRLTYVNAGHVPPYHVARDRTVRRLSGGGPPLGLLEGASYAEGQVKLEPGEVVAMVTDGLTEASSPDESEFGTARAGETLLALSAESAPKLLEGLVAAVDDWTGPTGCSDDLTTLVLRVL
jgi:sigma-B regulation protein RsbU (phosphoserine phosphatase)